MKSLNFISLDLELNSKKDGSIPRIIEVGISIGTPQEPENIVSFNWYIDPQESITPFITQLTGITDEIIKEKSVSHEIVAQELGELIKSYECFVNPITWGQDDARELKAEFQERNIDFPFFGYRIFDVKTLYVFDQLVKGKNPKGGLKSALGANRIKFSGTPHRAADDAKNTLLLFFKYLRKESQKQSLLNEFADLVK